MLLIGNAVMHYFILCKHLFINEINLLSLKNVLSVSVPSFMDSRGFKIPLELYQKCEILPMLAKQKEKEMKNAKLFVVFSTIN